MAGLIITRPQPMAGTTPGKPTAVRGFTPPPALPPVMVVLPNGQRVSIARSAYPSVR